MKLSTKGRYGLRALIDLAQHGGEGPVSITSIAERQEISERRMEASARNPRKKIAVRIPPIIERTSIVRLLFCAIPLFFKMEDCINQ